MRGRSRGEMLSGTGSQFASLRTAESLNIVLAASMIGMSGGQISPRSSISPTSTLGELRDEGSSASSAPGGGAVFFPAAFDP